MRSWQPKQLQCISRTRLLGSSEIRQKKLEVGLAPRACVRSHNAVAIRTSTVIAAAIGIRSAEAKSMRPRLSSSGRGPTRSEFRQAPKRQTRGDHAASCEKPRHQERQQPAATKRTACDICEREQTRNSDYRAAWQRVCERPQPRFQLGRNHPRTMHSLAASGDNRRHRPGKRSPADLPL